MFRHIATKRESCAQRLNDIINGYGRILLVLLQYQESAMQFVVTCIADSCFNTI